MSKSDTKSLSVLVIGRPERAEELIKEIDPAATVEHVESLDAALRSLRAEPSVDIVISQASELLPLQGSHFTGQAAAIIDGVNHGVCIVGKTGELVWANPIMLSFPRGVRERVSHHCLETFASATAEGRLSSSQLRGRRFSFRTADNEHFEVTATPVIDLHNRVTQVAAVVWDATNARRLQSKIDAIDQCGRELVSLDVDQLSRLNASERLALLEQKILHCTRDLLHFDNFEVRVLDRKTGRLDLVLASGLPADADHVDLYASSTGNGICGNVAARGRSYICPDTATDSHYIPGLENAKSSLTVPLRLHDRVVGVANFESTKPAAFSEDDKQFAEIFARYVALALHILELLVTERQATAGLLRSNVMAEITGPLNDIVTDSESLVEDYIGHDDLRHRLRSISESAVKIRDTIKELTSGRAGVIGGRSVKGVKKDPILEGKRILIADDEDTIRETVRDALTACGCAVLAASDGVAAIDLIARNSFDLVVSDIKMPLKSGYEVFAAAKEANPHTPVILSTGFGYDPNHAIVRARREGLAAVLFKPFKIDQLLTEIRTALQSATEAPAVRPG